MLVIFAYCLAKASEPNKRQRISIFLFSLLMQLLCRIKHLPLRPYSRIYSVALARSSQSSSKSLSAIDQLEQDGARILRAVQKRLDDRASLLAQISEDMSSPEDIKRARQAKELEPLQVAWDEWETNRQVRRSFSDPCFD